MSISPLEIMRGSILCHEGRVKKVKAVSELIMFEDAKAWIGGSMVNGEPVSVKWLEDFGFVVTREDTWGNGKMSVLMLGDGTFRVGNMPIFHTYVHQLQMAYFVLTGEHLKVPKLK